MGLAFLGVSSWSLAVEAAEPRPRQGPRARDRDDGGADGAAGKDARDASEPCRSDEEGRRGDKSSKRSEA